MDKRGKRGNCIKDRNGFTLVELLVGIVILSVVTAAVCSFIVIGSKNYAKANTEIMLQQEAQLALNQISDVVIDTTGSVNYEGAEIRGDGTSGSSMFAEKDADFTFEPQTKILTMYNGTKEFMLDSDGNKIQAKDEEGNPKTDENGDPVYEMKIEEGTGGNQNHYQFVWDKKSSVLYYNEVPVSGDGKFDADKKVVLAESVTAFSIDLSQVEEKRVVQVSMTFERDHKTYQTSNNITIRNKVQINDKDLEQLDKIVELRLKARENSVYLEPGEEYTFSTPLFSGQNIMDKSVTWRISDSTPVTEPSSGEQKTAFIDDRSGTIKISSGETVESFDVIVRTNAIDSKGNYAEDVVTVHVKRAKNVNLSLDGGNREITAGTDFTVNANVGGSHLGVSCDGCENLPAEDKYVVADEAEYSACQWKILAGEEYVELVSSGHKSASFKISADAKGGSQVIIQATSLLSAKRSYTKNGQRDIVSGTIVLTIKEDEGIRLDWNGDLLYGNGPNLLNAVGINSDDPVFLICVRVKKSEDAPVEDDMVMVYTTEGTNARLKPDTWLLNLNQQYFISIQIINILSDPALRDENHNKTQAYYDLRNVLSAWSGSGGSWSSQQPGGWAYETLKNYVENTFWPEYTSHLNPATGAYNGSKYPEYSNLMPGVVQTPKIGIESYLDGETHYDGVNAKTIYTVQRHGSPNQLDIPCRIGTVTSTWNSAVFQNKAFFNVYKGTGEDSSTWEKIYYSPENSLWPEQKSPYEGIGEIGNVLLFRESDLSNYVNTKVRVHFYNNRGDQYNNHNYETKKTAAGTYHYVPAVPYVNQPEGVYLKISDNYEINAGKQYVYDFTSTFNFEVKDGGNLTLWAYTDAGFKKGQIFFPVPSDSLQFPDRFKNPGADEVSIYNYDMTYLLDQDGKLHEPKFSEAKCRYDADRNRYELKLYYDYTDSIWGMSKRCCAGTFICEPDGDEWRLFNKGDYDEQFEAGQFDSIQIDGSNVSFVMKDNDGNPQNVKAYIPLPSDKKFTDSGWGNFGFKLQQEGQQVIESPFAYEFPYQVIGSSNISKRNLFKITCSYDKNTDTYTLEFVTSPGWDWGNNQPWGPTDTIKMTCKITDTKWTLVK